MIDLRALRDDPDAVRASQRARGDDPALVDAVLDADARRRTAIAAFENLRAEQKTVGTSVARASAADRPALLTRARHLADQVKAAQTASDAAESDLHDLCLLYTSDAADE